MLRKPIVAENYGQIFLFLGFLLDFLDHRDIEFLVKSQSLRVFGVISIENQVIVLNIELNLKFQLGIVDIAFLDLLDHKHLVRALNSR